MSDHSHDDISSIKPENPLPPHSDDEESNARVLAFLGILVAVALIVFVLAEASNHETGLAAQNVGTDGANTALNIPPATATGVTGTPVMPASPVTPPERVGSPLAPAQSPASSPSTSAPSQ